MHWSLCFWRRRARQENDLDFEALFARIRKSDTRADGREHQKTLDAARDLYYSLERPGDTAHRLNFQSFQPACARVACDVGLFQTLAASPPQESAYLAKSAGVDNELMSNWRLYTVFSTSLLNNIFPGRLLRYLASNGMVKETRDGKYTSTNITENLTLPGLRQGLGFGIDSVGPSAMAFPAFAQDHGYRNIDSGKNCAWQKGHNTDQSAFEWLGCHPKQLEEFDRWMTVQRADSGSFLEVFLFNIDELLACSNQHTFVDVGGGVGHQCLALVNMYPQFKGRVVLQDLPPVLEHALDIEGVETMAWDFWKSSEQPVRHASFYYMRNICHDFSDQACQTILNHVKRAVGPESKILIDEIVLAERNVHWRATQLDMLMMTCLGTGERTLRRWNDLLRSVGLKIESVHQYSATMGDSLIVAVPAE